MSKSFFDVAAGFSQDLLRKFVQVLKDENKIDEDFTISDLSEEQLGFTPKPKRGAAKKVAATATDNGEPKKKGGRPKKNAAKSEDSGSDSEKVEKKKPGKKPKKAVKQPEVADEPVEKKTPLGKKLFAPTAQQKEVLQKKYEKPRFHWISDESLPEFKGAVLVVSGGTTTLIGKAEKSNLCVISAFTPEMKKIAEDAGYETDNVFAKEEKEEKEEDDVISSESSEDGDESDSETERPESKNKPNIPKPNKAPNLE